METQLENRFLHLTIGADGRTARFTDKRTGENYATQASFARLKYNGTWHDACAVTQQGTQLQVAFAEMTARLTLAPTVRYSYLIFEVVALEGEGIEELIFVDLPLALQGSPEEKWTACALALDLQTNVPEIPGPGKHLQASCFPQFGFIGARVALIGCPPDQLRPSLQEVVHTDLRLPYSTIGGPWALDAPVNRGSYLFNFDGVTEENVDDWIELIHSLGFDQLDFHGGRSFRFGDCRPDPERYPRGFANLKAVIDRLHAAGIAAGLHTYSFFMAKTCPWVTPIPDPRLGKDATFTLASPLSPAADQVPVIESTAAMSATTGFFVRNSVTLQIDDELITYTGVAQDPPHGFTGCQRGAWGTRPAAHDQDARVHHLKECFGLFAPDPDTTLLAEVAAASADAFNQCGFDMIYLDALDGEDVLGGSENSWHYGSKFVMELWQRLERPALMEMSTFHHHLWYVRSRMGAWDHPTRSHKRFIDIHCAANQSCDRMFLPANLGWWAFKTWSGPQGEPTFSDDIEYLCAKALGTGAGLSLMGIDPTSAPQIPTLPRLAAIVKRYETLRRSGRVPESIKARLREPGAEFTLEQAAGDKSRFRPVHCIRHKVECLEDWSNRWQAHNPFAAQPAAFRIEALMTASPYEAPDNPVLADFADGAVFSQREAAPDVNISLEISTMQVKTGPRSACLGALNASSEAAGAWTRVGCTFSPPLDLSAHQGLGLWVLGDGQGELLNLQLRSPQHLSGAIGEHYLTVDFTGWRYFELIEPEGERYAEYQWPYGHLYSIYRESVQLEQIGSLDLWLNNLPPGRAVQCFLSPIKALSLNPSRLVHPTLTIGTRTIVFPVELESGSYLEFHPSTGCRQYGPKGELQEEVIPQGETPNLASGENQFEFSCAPSASGRPRARVTVFSQGEVLKG